MAAYPFSSSEWWLPPADDRETWQHFFDARFWRLYRQARGTETPYDVDVELAQRIENRVMLRIMPVLLETTERSHDVQRNMIPVERGCFSRLFKFIRGCCSCL